MMMLMMYLSALELSQMKNFIFGRKFVGLEDRSWKKKTHYVSYKITGRSVPTLKELKQVE
jgi:hypothetical protein